MGTHGPEGTPGNFAWMDGVEAAVAGKLDSTVASSTYLTGVGQAAITKRLSNGDDNVILTLGTGQAITDQVNQTYIATISPLGPSGVTAINTTGAGAAGIGFNIGQWIVNATDGASNLTRAGEFCNIEHDFIQFQQSGGTAIFNRAVSSRFRFAIPKTGVTIVNNKGIDFVVPNAGDVTGAVTNYIAINIPALTGGGGTNFYGIQFNNAPNGGSVVSANSDLVLKSLTNSTHINLLAASGGNVLLQAGSGGNVLLTPGSSGGYAKIGSAAVGAVGALQVIPAPGAPISTRLAYGTDGSGYKLSFAKNVAGTVTDLMTLQDNGILTLINNGLTAAGVISSTGAITSSFAVNTTSGGTMSSDSTLKAKTGFAAWNHAAPGAQPATPATLADVIAVLQGCGLTA